ncbi:hypothetical protein F5Y07DRAFT_380349 [Xylaria sp. FL0933]|nr:hypothetical protein F5Y07DRAFT_380349 [Xylaria sp. FL0933]
MATNCLIPIHRNPLWHVSFLTLASLLFLTCSRFPVSAESSPPCTYMRSLVRELISYPGCRWPTPSQYLPAVVWR